MSGCEGETTHMYVHLINPFLFFCSIVGTRKHQKIRIDGFCCLIQVFPGDLSVVQGFCEVWEVRNSLYLLIFSSVTVFPETLVSGPWEVLFLPDLAFPDNTSNYY